jgi:hypothetical protein
MKFYTSYLALALVAVFSSCKKEAEKPKVIYENKPSVKKEVVQDTTQLKVIDLPIVMEGTNYLLFPVGVLKADTKGLKSSYESSQSYTVSNYSEYQIAGYLQNLKFQEIGKDTIYSLTDKPIQIETVTYLKKFADRTKKQLLVYSIVDMDTNKDNKLDGDDIQALYMSDISGKNFMKLSTDFQELLDWNFITENNKLYFRTIEDTNKNGEFENKDTIHYFYVNLLEKEPKPVEYSR